LEQSLSAVDVLDSVVQLKRVGDKADYMGFTVIGARTFLGSGHPAEAAGGDADRGLIESTDSGKTWKTLSLGGTTDFHALKYAHNTVYGYDSTSGVLRVSKNRTTWDNRAQLAALDIAVSLRDPNLLLATTRRASPRARTAGGSSALAPARSWRTSPGRRRTPCTASTSPAACIAAPTTAPPGRRPAASPADSPRP
jgi:hypothetical protein